MIKKLVSIIMTLAAIFSISTPAMAAETGTISVTNAVVGKKYTIYRIFDLESYDAEANAYSYKINTLWGNWAKSQTNFITVDDLGYVEWKDGVDVSEFAKNAITYAKDNGVESQGMQTASDSVITFSNLKLGYYLVDSSTGVLCSLSTTNPDVEMKEKNIEPTVAKEVEEDSNGVYGETNDSDIHQTIHYRTTITVQPGGENYVLHDKMSKGLTFDNLTSVSVDGRAVASHHYTVSQNTWDGCTFELCFQNEYIGSLAAGKEIVVEYTAYLNEDAVIAGEGNLNETWLSYGDDNTTAHDYTRTYTWKAEVFKYTEKDGAKSPLAGAAFTISKNSDGSNPFTFSQEAGNMYKVATNGSVTEIITDGTGMFEISGLDEGIYYLTETKAPDGYHKLGSPVVFVITSSESGAENSKTRTFELSVEEEDGKRVPVSMIEIKNTTTVSLPKTGDIGTTRFYMMGGILFISAATLLIVKKRCRGDK